MTSHERGALTRYALFTVDSNVLLNLYGMEQVTRNAVLAVLGELSKRGRLFLTHQAAKEYQKNRPGKILEQLAPCSKTRRDLERQLELIEKALQELACHPVLEGARVLDGLDGLRDPMGRVVNELRHSEAAFREQLTEDLIRDQLDEIFDGAVCDPFSDEELRKIYDDGRRRYKAAIPPGYADSKEHRGSKDEPDCYGDLVLWKQLIRVAKAENRAVVLVSEDWKKGDWFRIVDRDGGSGRILGPRPELVDEMHHECGKRFHICRTGRFTEWMSDYLKSKLPEAALSELEETMPPTFMEVLTKAGEAYLRWSKKVAESPFVEVMMEHARARLETGEAEALSGYLDSSQSISTELLKGFQAALESGAMTIHPLVRKVARPECGTPSADFEVRTLGSDDSVTVFSVCCPNCGWSETVAV